MKTVFYHCEQIAHPTKDICLLTAIPSNKQNILHFQAGQYVEAKLSKDQWLPLSIANAPHESGKLEFHIRHNAKHKLAAKWLDGVLISQTLELVGPKGNTTLENIPPHSALIFLAGGTGYAPLRALLQDLFKTLKEKPIPVYLYWGIYHPEDAYDLPQLQAWKKEFSFFHYELVLSHPHPPLQWSGKMGWVHAYCTNQHTNFDKYVVFASGPFEMIKVAFDALTEKGLSPQNFISDMLASSQL